MMKTETKENKTAIIPVRMTESDAAFLTGIAKRKKTTVSNLVRKALEKTDIAQLAESDVK